MTLHEPFDLAGVKGKRIGAFAHLLSLEAGQHPGMKQQTRQQLVEARCSNCNTAASLAIPSPVHGQVLACLQALGNIPGINTDTDIKTVSYLVCKNI